MSHVSPRTSTVSFSRRHLIGHVAACSRPWSHMADESHASCLSSASFASQDVENPCPGTSGGARAAHAPLPRPHRRVCCAPPGTGHRGTAHRHGREVAIRRIRVPRDLDRVVLLLGDRCDCELVKAYADKGLNECRGSSRPWREPPNDPTLSAPAHGEPRPRAPRGLDADRTTK